MSELRKDPIIGRWVIVSQGRSQRPNDFEHLPVRRAAGPCPFCEGHEDSSPPEICAVRQAGTAPGSPGWQVRVVPNKFPALIESPDVLAVDEGLYQRLPGLGIHEVIVESPQHLTSTAELSDEHLAAVLAIYRDRLAALKRDPRLRYGLIFKNVGPAAGASLEHTHSQLIAMPTVPIQVAEELAGAAAHFAQRGGCIFCQMIADERALQQRVVLELDDFIAFCPFAARFPLETWIFPRAHASHFEETPEVNFLQLAQIIKRVIGRIERLIERPAYNYIIHNAPFDTPALGHYHWHIEIIPRVSNVAGFEWGTGCYINPLPPEEAAASLRAAND